MTAGEGLRFIIRLPKKAALLLIRFYQIAVSPLLPPSCRFYPTCSAYAYEAVRKYGLFKGGRLAVWRILRCNPYHKGGYDPVP
jgi:putative membrane protein insertion efficiency factor